MQITLVLHNIRSVYNVGAILRTAECLGVEKVAFSGYTPRYNDKELLPHLRAKLNHQIEKVALGAEKLISLEAVDELGPWLALQKAAGKTIVGLENNLSAEELPRKLILGSKRQATLMIHDMVLILGEEVSGIPADIRAQCDYFLEIPMRGQKESFNVSVATGIALWGLIGR